MPDGKVSVDVTFVPEGQWSNPFVDVPDNAWYYDAVKYVNENGLMTGTGANTFEPNLTTTRGMFVTILYRLEGSPTIENGIGAIPSGCGRRGHGTPRRSTGHGCTAS